MASNNKYDRQLRLWGAAGQAALGETCVILLQATAAGCETVKNLVLPGVGGLIVVDDAPFVTAQDAASNFFVTLSDSPGNPHSHNNSHNNDITHSNHHNSRCAVAAQLLGELNPDVFVRHVFLAETRFRDISDWKIFLANTRAQQAPQFTRCLVVASDLDPPVLLKVADACDSIDNPLVVVQAYGLLGTVRLQTTPLALLHPQPRATRPDWRIAQPFPALQQFLDTYPGDLAEQLPDSKALGHVPYPVILHRALQQFRQEYPSAQQKPTSFQDKQRFVQIIKDMVGNKYTYADFINFQEAVQNAYLAYSDVQVDVDTLLAKAQTAGLEQLAWVLQAVQDFVMQHNGALPLAGRALPDLTADTAAYVQMQRIYRTQAETDLQQLAALVAARVAAATETTPGSTNKMPSSDTLKAVCQNLPHLQVYTTSTLAQEYGTTGSTCIPPNIIEELQMAVMEVVADDGAADDDDTQAVHAREMLPLWWCWGVRACHEFFLSQGRYPGTVEHPETMTKDVAMVQSLWLALLQTYQITNPSPDFAAKLATEMVRYGAAEIHNIAAVIGGVASQEAVKLITGQYVPVQNTYVYNGIASVGGVYQF